MGEDRITRLLKKDYKRAKSDHAAKMEELSSNDDTTCNGSLGDW